MCLLLYVKGNEVKLMTMFDDGYRFLKPIRGTPAFWQGAQQDLLACVRQLGVLTWFCSFSSADLRWQDLLSSILKQEGRTETVEQIQWDVGVSCFVGILSQQLGCLIFAGIAF